MDLEQLNEQGLKLRKRIFGAKAIEERERAFGEFGAPLRNMINGFAYGDVWSRPELPLKARSLVVLALTAAINRPAEFRVHVQGALANGCSAEEIREVLLLVAVYCGIPASIEAHRIAYEVLQQPAARK